MNGAGLRDPRSFAPQWALVLLWLGFAFVGLRQAHNPQRAVDFCVYRLAAERFVPREVYAEPAAEAEIARAAIVDTETTGTDVAADAVIE